MNLVEMRAYCGQSSRWNARGTDALGAKAGALTGSLGRKGCPPTPWFCRGERAAAGRAMELGRHRPIFGFHSRRNRIEHCVLRFLDSPVGVVDRKQRVGLGIVSARLRPPCVKLA